MVYIYILQLDDNKYYIGKTTQPDIRLDSHFNSNGSTWSKKYKPIKIIGLIPDCDNYDEDKYTIKYMQKYGIENVRGGSFCEIILSKETITTIEKMINSVSDNCYMCGSQDHFIKDCDMKFEKIKELPHENTELKINTTVINEKCNCISSFLKPHRRKKCLINNFTQPSNKIITPSLEKQDIQSFNKTINSSLEEQVIQPLNKIISSSLEEQIISLPSEKQDIIQPSNKIISIIQSDNKICKRCGRKGHLANDCFANKHNNGKIIPDIKVFYCSNCNKVFDTQKGATCHENLYCKQKNKPIKKESNDKCYKCGREGHYSNDCYANKHVNGKYIN